jgi:type II secretory pathway pseudopilin PulG
MKNIKTHQLAAFTLVELSIVLLIIGLIIGGITAGSSLIKQSQIRSTVAAYNSYTTAINTFKIQFNALPGDFTNANAMWPSAVNGNGDGAISIGGENLNTWLELTLNNNLTGSYSGTSVTSTPTPGVNVPQSRINNNVGFDFDQFSAYGLSGLNPVQLSSLTNSCCNALNGNGVAALDAYNIDIKMDDGLPSKGKLITIRAANLAGNTTCIDQPSTVSATTTVNYLLSDLATCCRVDYMFN